RGDWGAGRERPGTRRTYAAVSATSAAPPPRASTARRSRRPERSPRRRSSRAWVGASRRPTGRPTKRARPPSRRAAPTRRMVPPPPPGPTLPRSHPEFGRVMLIRSDLESDTKQLTVALAGTTKRGATVRVSYTLTRSMDQSSFACCSAAQGFAAPTTAADPNVPEWATSDLERRHAVLTTLTYPLSDALES